MRRLDAMQFKDAIEVLAEHTIETQLSVKEVTRALFKRYLEIALDMHRGNQWRTAQTLGVHRNTLAAWIDLYGVARIHYTRKFDKKKEVSRAA